MVRSAVPRTIQQRVRNRCSLFPKEQSSSRGFDVVMKRTFADIATTIDQLSGRPLAFGVALLIIAVWAITGPLFHFSDTWQLVINTGTSVITFLMVFVIQNTQNRDGAAIQAKLDELIRVSAARNALIGIEMLTQEEIEDLRSKSPVEDKRIRKPRAAVSKVS
jgi:low affinity Fe/Cu permease